MSNLKSFIMKKLLLFAIALVVIGLCSSNSSMRSSRAPDCATCLTIESSHYPSDPYGWTPCYSSAEGFCGWTSQCGPGTTSGCSVYVCNDDIDGCDGYPY